jgi:hypothetical protein
MTPEQRQVRARLQRIAKLIDDELPKGYGFFVMCFPFNDPNSQGEYASNAQWGDVAALMKKLVARRVMQEPGRN